jgi:MYXO-CTERM domain-containing protein
VADADCGGATSGQVCAGQTCQTGCRGSGGNGCPSGLVCSSTGGGAGSCVGCAGDADCGGGASGQVCVSETCQAGCRGSGNGCPSGSTCSSADGEVGTCAVSSVTVTVIATGPDALPNGATPGGTGVLCAARPGPAGDDATWLLGLAIGALALGARRRRAA